MAAEGDYYEVLGVPAAASAEEVKKAFRERVRACHPDRVANLDEDLRRLAEEKMVQLNEAYAVLRNQDRRAAYDDRFSKAAPPPPTPPAAPESGTQSAPANSGGPTSAVAEHSPSLADPGEARNRIGEQRFVARAASEEFQHTVKRVVPGNVSWAPLAYDGATEAMHGHHGRSNYYFVLLAAPQLDNKQIQRFLKSLETFSAKLNSRLFGQDRLFGFAGAVEFSDPGRQKSALERFNSRRSRKALLQPATFIDLVNWHVVPGETSLQVRLEDLLRGR